MAVASASRIAVLPSAVADQIAAGEVVERPSSVVKELVENALDAGATAIDLAIEDGGRQSIRVSDDGIGMSRDDAVLSLERHATSKIRSAQDLVGVRSFGFRGEALAAICSVSQLEVETAQEDGAGTLVRAAAGTVLEVVDAARRRGTTIRVSRLFYNAPARLKFLRGTRSEWRAVLDVIGTMSLTRRDVRVSVTHDGKPMLTLPVASSLRDRLGAVYGGAFAGRLLDVDDLSGSTHVCGLVERPADVGTATRRIFLSINGRSIRDLGIVRAAEAAYRSTIPAGVRPTLFLDIVVASDMVDVNVHPAKAEVRFRDRWQVERTVETAVRRALGTFDAGATFGRTTWTITPAVETEHVPVDVGALQAPSVAADGLFEPPAALAAAAAVAAPAAPSPQPASDVPPLMQLQKTYMMFEHEHGVVLIDQHSAHERILYEQFMGTLERGDNPSQRLLFPMTLHLGPAESEAFERNRELFERLGFEIDGFGGHTLIVSAVPMPHPRFDPERCLRETLASLTGDRDTGAHARHERLAATVACKAAIKAGDALSPGEMRALYVALRDTTLPAHDVHGRATIVQLTWDEIERPSGRAADTADADAADAGVIDVAVICGPTAAGKSAIAMWIAERAEVTIVSADSRQVYRDFDIGTAKPSTEECARVPHRGIGVVPPTVRYSAAAWAESADRWIAEARSAERLPLVVGGTGLYLRALLDGLFEEPELDAARRGHLANELAPLATEELRRWVAILDPTRAHLGRTQLLRAAEIALLTGHRLSDLHRDRARAPRWRPRYLVVDPGPALADRIAARIDHMLDNGWPEEVTRLMHTVPADAPAWNATGYDAVRGLVAGSLTRAAAREQILIGTRQYAKRQRTWFRNQLGPACMTHVDPLAADWPARVEQWMRGETA